MAPKLFLYSLKLLMILAFEIIFVFFLGLAIGSFLNVVTLRLAAKNANFGGRSKCMACNAVLALRDLIPLLSFFLLRGKCRSCAVSISWQYPLVEAAMGLCALVVYVIILAPSGASSFSELLLRGEWPIVALFIRDLFFLAVLICVFITDFRWYAIHDGVIAIGSIGAIAFHSMIGAFVPTQASWPLWINLAVAALVGALFFGGQYVLSKGKWIGGGDIMLGAMMGFMLGFPGIVIALFISYMLGSVVALWLLVSGKKKIKSEVPLGTFLTIGAAIMILWGPWITDWAYSMLLL